jgi:hypothetical protein
MSASFNRSFGFSSWIYASDVLAFESPPPQGDEFVVATGKVYEMGKFAE